MNVNGNWWTNMGIWMNKYGNLDEQIYEFGWTNMEIWMKLYVNLNENICEFERTIMWIWMYINGTKDENEGKGGGASIVTRIIYVMHILLAKIKAKIKMNLNSNLVLKIKIMPFVSQLYWWTWMDLDWLKCIV